MSVKNMVIAGEYDGKYVQFKNKKKGLYIVGNFGLGKKIFINKETVDYFEVVGEEQYRSFGNAVARGIIGGIALGGIGAVAGAATTKEKGSHMVSIVFKTSKKSLLELDDAMFKNLVMVLY